MNLARVAHALRFSVTGSGRGHEGVEARTLHNWTAVLDEVRQRVAEQI